MSQNPNVKQTPQPSLSAAKLLNQPSISITPLPRQASASQASTSTNAISNMKPGKPVANSGGKSSFVVCEICDGYIKVCNVFPPSVQSIFGWLMLIRVLCPSTGKLSYADYSYVSQWNFYFFFLALTNEDRKRLLITGLIYWSRWKPWLIRNVGNFIIVLTAATWIYK